MELSDTRRIRIDDPSGASEARQTATAMCRGLGFDETLAGRAAIIASELATNVARHAGRGEVIIRSVADETPFLEILALDRGRGMEDLTQCLRDGYSTAGGAGTGLGTVARLSSVFDIHSRPGQGTAVYSRREDHTRRKPLSPHPWMIGAVCLPTAGEPACGDAWAADQSEQRAAVLVVDGLGHGRHAAEAAQAAVAVFRRHRGCDPPALLELIHDGIRGTRGVAAAIAEVDPSRRRVRYAGVGNIAARILTADSDRRLVSRVGALGHEVREIQEFSYPWADGAVLIMHSDGLKSQWEWNAYPGLAGRYPALIAGVLCRDHERGTDDLTVLSLKGAGPSRGYGP